MSPASPARGHAPRASTAGARWAQQKLPDGTARSDRLRSGSLGAGGISIKRGGGGEGKPSVARSSVTGDMMHSGFSADAGDGGGGSGGGGGGGGGSYMRSSTMGAMGGGMGDMGGGRIR